MLAELLNNTKRRLAAEADAIRLASIDAKRLPGDQRARTLKALEHRRERLRQDELGLAEGFAKLNAS
jgi:hypothetical protein